MGIRLRPLGLSQRGRSLAGPCRRLRTESWIVWKMLSAWEKCIVRGRASRVEGETARGDSKCTTGSLNRARSPRRFGLAPSF